VDPTDRSREFRDKLAGIAAERSARAELVRGQVESSRADVKQRSDALIRYVGAVAERLNERQQQQNLAVDWLSGRAAAKKRDEEDSFGFEEDDEAREEPAAPPPAPAPTPTPPTPSPWPRKPSPGPVEPVGTLPERVRPQPPRPTRRSAVDDDDFAHTDWTAD